MGKPSLLSATIAGVKACPREIYNSWLLFCTIVWSFSGVAKGFDEGNIASVVVQKSFQRAFGIANQTEAQYANTKGWIVSIATAGAVIGCLACINVVQIFGRKWTMLGFTIIYIGGILGQTFSGGSLAALYVTRFIAGIGIGATTVVPSIYLSEIAPRSIRGLVTLQYTCCQQLGVVFGFFFNYGITKHHAGTKLQWQLPTGLQAVPAVIWAAGIIFTPESPRFLLSENKPSEALRGLCKLRGLPADHEYIKEEFAGVKRQLNAEIEAVGGAGTWDLIVETFSVTENRRRFVLMFTCHLFGQWSGANAITQYSPSIFGYLGIQGEESRFLATGLYSIVKFVSVLVFSIFVIDFIGRRRSLMLGIILQIITLAFVGIYLGVTNGDTVAMIKASASATAASRASIVAIYVHAVAWSIGWFSIPYLVSAEVFPIRIRSLNSAGRHEALWCFFFFACMCSFSLVYVFFALPETAGRSLESMDALFERPWYTVRRVAYTDLGGPSASDSDDADGSGKNDIEELEYNGAKDRVN